MKKIPVFLLLTLHFVVDNVAQDSTNISYSINISAILREGRLGQFRLPISGGFTISNSTWETDLFSNYSYQKTNGDVLENELLSRLLISIFPNRRWSPMVGYLFVRSQFYQLKSRSMPGLGAKWQMVENKKSNIIYYGWAAYDDSKFKNIVEYQTFRFNNLIIGKHPLLKDKLMLEYALYFFQSLEVRENFIWRFTPKLLIQITKNFSMSINLESHFENITVPPNTKRNSALTIGCKFGN